MRKGALVAGNPWTVLITLEADPDSMGCQVSFQEITMDGKTADQWELRFDRVEEALREIEMAYGVGPDDWTDLD